MIWIMKAIRYDRFGGPEVLRLADMPEPKCGDGEVLIDAVSYTHLRAHETDS